MLCLCWFVVVWWLWLDWFSFVICFVGRFIRCVYLVVVMLWNVSMNMIDVLWSVVVWCKFGYVWLKMGFVCGGVFLFVCEVG